MKGRTYRYLSESPLFPFGHGLSYTTFSIGKARTSHTEIRTGENIRLTIPVKNTGKRRGTEILQVYVKKLNDEGPVRTLRSFTRIDLKPGTSEEVVLELTPSFFEWYSNTTRRMDITPGEYELFYGTSSDEKDLQKLAIRLL
ncbi:MAG: fibronectin type III-like domain-contianing protein [Bacteroides sp.]|nr:fibronectin type III-like domain-contianing protein [Bacteroides sp.]